MKVIQSLNAKFTCYDIPDGQDQNKSPAKGGTNEGVQKTGEYDGDVEEREFVADHGSVEKNAFNSGYGF